MSHKSRKLGKLLLVALWHINRESLSNHAWTTQYGWMDRL